MPEKSGFPLRQPPSQKRGGDDVPGNKYIKPPAVYVSESKKGDSQGGKGRAAIVEALLKCTGCGRVQKITFATGKYPEYHRCSWCNELYPTDGYRVIAYGIGLPQPLAPHEVKARQVELERLHTEA